MNKAEIDKLRKKILREEKVVVDHLNKKELAACSRFNEAYKIFLNEAKTERKAALKIIELAKKNGFVDIDSFSDTRDLHKKPDKLYKIFKDKCVALAVLGKKSLLSGANIIASHIDSPRLDLKQNPLYEDLNLSLLKTHYYGGIRKYQWLSIPLALHGTVFKSSGKTMDITIGEDSSDPVFTVSDLLPHLAGKLQSGKKLTDVFDGEKLNLIAGSLPLGGPNEKDRFKLNLLNLLNTRYNLLEEDFISAEIEAVPSEKARDVGFDRSMIGAYGQDDRVCAYTSMMALLDLEQPPARTAVSFFFDKEEIGSDGNTGAKSSFIEDFMSDLLSFQNQPIDSRSLRKTLISSQCLSADVNAAMDPDFKEVHEKLNAAKLGCGVCMTKFTGSGGKSGSSDASAEFVGKIRMLFNQNKIIWQTGELGKIDEGGGGTVAKFLAELGMDVLDCGPALLSMHSPFEVSSKADVYMTYKGYHAFFAWNDDNR